MFQLDVRNLQAIINFSQDAPIMAYQQHDQTSFCFSSSDSALKAPNQFSDSNEIVTHISSFLTVDIPDKIMFANATMTDKKIIKGHQHLRYKL